MIARRTFLASSVLLAGCGGGGSDAPDPPVAAAPASVVPAPALAVVDRTITEPFRRGNPADTPLVVAPAGPASLSEWLGEDVIAGFVKAGFFVVGRHWPGTDGGAEDYGARHGEIAAWIAGLGLAAKPMLYAQSRGGLQLLNFACDHPDSFQKIACLYPDTDPFVFPGGGDALWNAYGATAATFPVVASTPNLRAASLKGRPIKIWHGDADTVVPKRLTTDVFAPACGAEVVTLAGVGHVPLWLPEIPAWLKA